MFHLIAFLLLNVIMVAYFRIAKRYNIVDRPNERSSHKETTIRGGGVIFVVAILISGFREPYYWLPVCGAFLIGIISFLDDRIDLSKRIRFIGHLLSVSIIFGALGFFSSQALSSLWILLPLYIVVIGTINAYNFMDGINGITGLYSLALLAGLQYVNLNKSPFLEPDLIWLPMIGCGIFLFYNLRRKAKCFAGDVGSITIAYWIVYLLLKLIFISGDLSYVLFLSLYGVDAVMTILHRLYLRQNIFQAHRMHFYQILVNEKGFSHVSVASCYGIVQAAIIALVLFSGLSFWTMSIICLVPLLTLYCLKFKWLAANKTIAS